MHACEMHRALPGLRELTVKSQETRDFCKALQGCMWADAQS